MTAVASVTKRRSPLDSGAPMGDFCTVLSSPTFLAFEKVLTKLKAKRSAGEVHALYLGAITSTSFQLGPQHLLGHIFDDEPMLGTTGEDGTKNLETLFGYWNTILSERDAGRLRLAPMNFPAKPTREALIDYARRREEELLWYVRGIDAGGDDPMEFGDEGKWLLEGIAKGSGHLHAYADLLERTPSPTSKELVEGRATLLELVKAVERLICDLTRVSDAVRREAMQTFSSEAGRETNDGARIARPVKIGRNDACPCGSGKKWKKCCGSLAPVQ